MPSARDRYQKTAKEEQAEHARRAHMQHEMRDYFALLTIYHACYDAWGDIPGTFSNTMLQAFVATDPRADPWHRVPGVPQYRELRTQAWRALSGEYQRHLLKG